MRNFLFLLCLSANIAAAQTYEYEFTAIVPLDAMDVEYNANRIYQDSFIKLHTFYYSKPYTDYNDDLGLCLDIKNALIMHEIPGFYDEKMEHPFILDPHILPPKEFVAYDTLPAGANSSAQQQFQLQKHLFSMESIVGYALQHKIIYNAQNQSIAAKISSIAFVERVKGYKTGYYHKFYCWTPLNNEEPINALNIRDTNLVWAKLVTISMPDSALITPTNANTFSGILLKDVKQNKLTTYNTLDWIHTPLSEEEINDILLPTQKDSLSFQENAPKRLRFKLIYYYNKENMQLGCKVERIGIEQDVKTSKGDFERRQALFYIKPEN